MSHAAQQKFCKQIKELLPEYFYRKKVLDVGSLDINGNNNYLFTDCQITRMDIYKGANVDFVSLTHKATFTDGYFDTIISTECFEHDMYYDLSIKNILRMLMSQGLFLFTCGGPGREEHGTARMEPGTSPFTSQVDGWKNYYHNIDRMDIERTLRPDSTFKLFGISEELTDMRFWGIKK